MDLSFAENGVLIGDRWRPARLGNSIPVEDPSTGEIVGTIPAGDADDVSAAVEAAEMARKGEWGEASDAERGRLLMAIGRAVAAKTEYLAELEARDVGKPISQARADVEALARYLEFYGGAAGKLHGETIPFHAGYTVYTLREPHGVTGHIIPWNYPMQIIGRSVVAALAMGNAAVLKPAEQASLTAIAFARIAREAGLPAGALNVVPGLGMTAGAALVAHPSIHHVSFTGSSNVGAAVQAAASSRAVPVTLELGGKSPQLVFADADLERALPYLVRAGVQNAGQTCSAGSRILVQRARHNEVIARLSERFGALVAGPALADCDLGPLISARQHAAVSRYVAQAAGSIELMATGGIHADAPARGHYFPAMLFAGHDPTVALAQEEIFGPVVTILPFDDEEEAVAIANGTPFGLVAGVWSRDGGRQLRLARQLRAGQVFLNDYGAAGGVELPFGGIGLSGHGREKGMEALRGFSVVKTVAAWHG